jgi:hypothetical protein
MNARFALLAAPLAASLVGVAPPAFAAPNLVKVGDTGKVSVWVDKESIRRTGTQARAALEWRWTQATPVPDQPARMYRLERQVQLSNCENKSYAVAEGTHYADDRGIEPVGSYKYEEALLPYSVAPARTIRDAVVTYVCQATPPAPAKKS